METCTLVERISVQRLFCSKDRVIVAVSGGPDSVCLALLMHHLSSEAGFYVHFAHMNHSFRGDDAAGDAEFVRNLAKELGVAYTIETVDVPSIIAREGGSSQAISRRLRYQFLKRLADKHSCNKVALGHNKDDQAETLLINLLRGAGTSGLGAMAIKTHLTRDIALVRPLLSTTREEIVQFLQDRQQPYRVDASNLTDKYLRNHIRHHLVPFLKKHYNNAIVDRLYDTAAILRTEDDFVNSQVQALAITCLHKKNNAVILSCKEYGQLHRALQSRVLREGYRMLAGTVKNISKFQLDQMHEVAMGPHGGRVELYGKVTCEKVYEQVILHRNNRTGKGLLESQIRLAVPGEVVLPQGRITAEIYDAQDINLKKDSSYAFLDLDSVGRELYIRSRRPGDSFVPFGMRGTKKIQDFLTDNKVPHYLRDEIPLLVTAEEDIAWVVPFRISNKYRITTNTRKVLVCRFERSI